MASSFNYAALPPGSIRLLHISPLTPSNSQLACRIEDVSLDNPPKFYALSYTWGTPDTTWTILCNGRRMEIAANLHEAICTLFGEAIRLDLPIWIDAICINQKDDEEKSVQVARMGDVYCKATRVVVWLGPGTAQSDLAMESLEWLSRDLKAVTHPPDRGELQASGLPDQLDEIWPALGDLYRRKWFSRLWTFQEAVLAAEIQVVCGMKRVEWTIFATVTDELYRLGIWPICYGFQDVERRENGVLSIANIIDARQDIAQHGELLATYCIQISDRKLCFDPRDRVYGMLGLTSSSFSSRVHISYANASDYDFLQTFIEFSKACIEEKSHPILSIVAGRSCIAGLPSWCPNLQSTQGDIRLFGDHHRAGISTSLSGEQFRGQTSSESNKLTITGFRVDKVAEVVEGTFSWPIVPTGEPRIKRAQRFLDWEGRCLALAQRTLSVPLETVPLDHVFALSSNTPSRLSGVMDADFHQSYIDDIEGIKKAARNEDISHPSSERRALYDDTWQRIVKTCSGRRYFSTEKGRLGIGPPDIKKRDTICVLYGTRPVFVLRPAEENPEHWYFVGDAFVHGLMELDDTPESAKDADEDFVII